MKERRILVPLAAALLLLVFGSFVPVPSGAQTAEMRSLRKMSLTGQIVKAKQGYIIQSWRGNAPSELFTILNPNPRILDELVKSRKTVSIEARVVSGDNLEIEKIDGAEYSRATQ